MQTFLPALEGANAHPQRRHAQSRGHVAAARRRAREPRSARRIPRRDRRLVDATPAGPTRWNPPSAAARARSAKALLDAQSILLCRETTVARDVASSRLRASCDAGAESRGRVAIASAVDRRLVVGRARDERDDDGGARAALSVSWVCRSTSSAPARSRTSCVNQRERRIVGALLRRSGRSEHDDRSLRRAQGARRRSASASQMRKALDVILRGGGVVERARLHEDLARALRRVSVVGRAVAAARDRLLSAVDAVQSLRFRLLGARHRRAADDRRFEEADARARRRRQRDRRCRERRTSCTRVHGRRHWLHVRRAPAETLRTLAASAVSRRRAAAHRAVGDRASRGRRELGRHSAAVGLLVDRARPDGLLARSSRDAQGHRGHAALHHRRCAGLALSGLHVAGVGHGVGGARAGACGFRRVASGDAPRRELAAARADSRRCAGRLAHEVRARRAATAGPSSSTTTPIPTSTTRRSSCWRCSKAAIAAPSRASVERARRWTLAMDSRNGAWAAFDRDNTRELLYQHAVLGFRRDDRSADGRRDRARARDAGGARLRHDESLRRARLGVSARRRRSRGVRGTGAGASITSTARGA